MSARLAGSDHYPVSSNIKLFKKQINLLTRFALVLNIKLMQRSMNCLLILQCVLSVSLLVNCNSKSTAGPDSDNPDQRPPPRTTVQFRKIAERGVPEFNGSDKYFPTGLAVSPDGRWLIGLGHNNGTIGVYDAQTLDLLVGPLQGLDSVPLVTPRSVFVGEDASFGVLTAKSGIMWFSIPSLGLLTRPVINDFDPSPRALVRDHRSQTFYTGGDGKSILRLNRSGQLEALYSNSSGTTGLSLTRDGSELLVLTDWGRRLTILRALDLTPRLSITLPLTAEVIVPLRRGNDAIIIGGLGGGGPASAEGPIVAMSVDLDAGALGVTQVLFEGRSLVGFGEGNTWTEVGKATAIIPTGVGMVTIDTNYGLVTLHSAQDLQADLSPCCDIASYPDHKRVVIAARFGPTSGKFVVYEIEEAAIVIP